MGNMEKNSHFIANEFYLQTAGDLCKDHLCSSLSAPYVSFATVQSLNSNRKCHSLQIEQEFLWLLKSQREQHPIQFAWSLHWHWNPPGINTCTVKMWSQPASAFILPTSFLKSNPYHFRCLFLKYPYVLSHQIIKYDCIHTSSTAKSLIFKSVFSASPYLFKQRNKALYPETSTPVPIQTYNTPTRCQCQFNLDSHLSD